ncbi:hypothetical protein BHE74_00009184 [Ensete ventricosum]|nr:hypothetical protein BHE74_00009184 [Ensete ventricosum]RZR79776.1 hypothetical protein BHM03_00005604 [Ensete ventricosum]
MEESDVNPTGLIENQNTTKRKREEEIGNRAEVQRGKRRIVPLVARASALLAEEGTEKRRIDVVDHVARVRVSLPPARRYRDQKEAPQGPCLKTNVDGCKPRQLHVSNFLNKWVMVARVYTAIVSGVQFGSHNCTGREEIERRGEPSSSSSNNCLEFSPNKMAILALRPSPTPLILFLSSADWIQIFHLTGKTPSINCLFLFPFLPPIHLRNTSEESRRVYREKKSNLLDYGFRYIEREGIFCGKMGSSTDNLKGFVLALLSSGFIGASFIIKKKGLRRAAAASGVRAGQLFSNSTSSC